MVDYVQIDITRVRASSRYEVIAGSKV